MYSTLQNLRNTFGFQLLAETQMFDETRCFFTILDTSVQLPEIKIKIKIKKKNKSKVPA